MLSKMEQSEKPEILTPNPIQYQETFNNSIVDKVLSFTTHPHTTYLVKLNHSYCNRKTARKREFQQKAGNRFEVRVK
jgi:hypothetical protein